jgi:transcriptional regulator with XRE-family HTH domain
MITQYEYRKLIGRIVEKYGTRKEFAKVLGISENSMSLKLNGKTGFSREDMVRWGELLDIDVNDFGAYFFT